MRSSTRCSAKKSGIADGIGACTDFDPEVAMTPKDVRRSDRYTQLAVAAATQAAEEADVPEGVDLERARRARRHRRRRAATLEEQCRNFFEGGERAVSPHFVPMMMPNAAAGVIAMRLGAHGPGFSVSSACATGGHAIGEALRMITRGEADVVVAGGTEAALTGVCLAAFRRMGALSREGVSRPFDARRDGFVMGEGAGVLVLERAEHAKARGATIYGRIAGYGASNDAFHITQPDAEGRGAARGDAARRWRTRARRPADVGYLNAHGTGTPFNDKIETAAIKSVFNGSNTPPPVSSTKSAIGHLLGAAGAVEAIACLEAVRRGVLPPTLNYAEPDPECDLDYVPEGPREAPDLEIALSNSFGFGGQNACLAVAKAWTCMTRTLSRTPWSLDERRLRRRPRGRAPGHRGPCPPGAAVRPRHVPAGAHRRRRRRALRQRKRERAPGLRLGAGRRLQGRLPR